MGDIVPFRMTLFHQNFDTLNQRVLWHSQFFREVSVWRYLKARLIKPGALTTGYGTSTVHCAFEEIPRQRM